MKPLSVNSSKRRRAFRKVELVVVLSIIAGLAALLVGPIRKAREEATRSACL